MKTTLTIAALVLALATGSALADGTMAPASGGMAPASGGMAPAGAMNTPPASSGMAVKTTVHKKTKTTAKTGTMSTAPATGGMMAPTGNTMGGSH